MNRVPLADISWVRGRSRGMKWGAGEGDRLGDSEIQTQKGRHRG
jgi:hypothetical protein